MNRKLMEILKPACILVFKTRRVKKQESRKRTGPFFTASARCKIPGCHTYRLHMENHPEETTSKLLDVTVIKYGSPRHGDFFSHRRLTGKDRRSAADMVNVHGVYQARGMLLDEAPENQLRAGNLTEAPPAQVLRQAGYERRQSGRYSLDWCEDIATTMKVSQDEDIVSKKLPGRVHLVGKNPLSVHMYREHFFL